jgi:hypothetical protein
MNIYILLLFYFIGSSHASFADKNLLLWYPFSSDYKNYATGSGVLDATLRNGTQLETIHYGNPDSHGVLRFRNVSQQYFQINSFTTGNTGLSFAFWFKSNYNGQWARVFEFGNGPYTSNLYFAPFNAQFFFWFGHTSYSIVAPSECNSNIWCFIAITMTYSVSGQSNWVLYSNGSRYATCYTNLYPTALLRKFNYFGKSNWVDPYYNGLIGEFRLYQTVLTEYDVQNLYYGSSLKAGLVAFYPFDGNANDYSGNGNHGVVHGGISLAADRFGNPNSAYHFDGSSGYIDILGSPFNFLDAFSISFWVNPAKNQNPWILLFDKSCWGTHYGAGWRIQQNSNSYYFGYVYTTNNLAGSHAFYLKSNTFTHVVAIKRDRSTFIYLNGILNFTSTSLPSSTIVGNGNLPLVIGAQNTGLTYPASNVGNFFQGILDCVSIYNRSISLNEVVTLYNSNPTVQFLSKPSLKQGLVAYYPFDGNADDASGNGNNGVIYRGASLVADRFGNDYHAMQFDGSTGYIEIPGNQFNFEFNMTSPYGSTLQRRRVIGLM